MASNVPALWHAESTTDADRKAILREVIDRVEVDVEGESEWVSARIHWVGGGLSETRIRRPVQRMDQLSTWPAIRRRIEERLAEGVSAPRIAAELNAGGILTARGQPVTEGVVRSVMTREGLRSTRSADPSDSPPLGPDEWRGVWRQLDFPVDDHYFSRTYQPVVIRSPVESGGPSWPAPRGSSARSTPRSRSDGPAGRSPPPSSSRP